MVDQVLGADGYTLADDLEGVSLSNGKHRPKTLDEVRAWIAQHGGEADIRRQQQDTLNEKTADTLDEINDKLSALTTRIAWATGAAIMLGGVITLVFRAVYP